MSEGGVEAQEGTAADGRTEEKIHIEALHVESAVIETAHALEVQAGVHNVAGEGHHIHPLTTRIAMRERE
eukprot:2790488-Amphidinium_carterae.1